MNNKAKLHPDDESASSSSEDNNDYESTLKAAKKAKSLVTEITEISTRLSSLMRNEDQDGKERTNVLQFLNSTLEDEHHDHVESSISRILQSTNCAVERLDKQCKILISNQQGMEEKIRKKTLDLERTSKRLESLKHVRPAYMDEYEQLEEELQVEYERYVVRLRNKDYLEGELSAFKKLASERQKKAERSMKRMQKKFKEEELRILNGGDDYERESTPMSRREVQSRETVECGDKAANDNGEASRMDASFASASSRGDNSFIESDASESPSEPSSGGGHSFFDEEGDNGSHLDDSTDSSDSNF